MDTNDRREMTRVSFSCGVTVQSENRPAISGHIADVSLKGIYIISEHLLPVGSTCQLTLCLWNAEEPMDIELKGLVARVDEQGMAIEINDVLPIDTFTYLQNVVRYNAIDSTRIDHEVQDRVARRWQRATAGTALPK